jgi:hypothetical protein
MDENAAQYGGCGCGVAIYNVGMCIACIVSWEQNRSILWAAIDGLLGWMFVVYHFWIVPLMSQ